jgi:methylase of polypeptide subunit release factors
LAGKLRPGGGLLLEIGQGQREAVTGLLQRLYPAAEIAVAPDLRGIDRVVSLVMPVD